MNVLTEPQVIKQDDKPAFAVIPWDVYQELVKNYIPDESDVWFPQEVVEANVVRGDSLLKAWREYLGLTQAEVAKRAGIEGLFIALGAEVTEGKGSRVRVALNDIRAVFHRPHPTRVTNKGSVKSVRRFLIESGVKS
jgi:HicA toxin of bacterial toxin-antitoxin,